MAGPKEKQGKIDKIISISDNVRKLAVNFFVFAAATVIIISTIVHYNKRQLVIYPFQIPLSFKEQGYTGEIMSLMVLDQINEIKKVGGAYYLSNNIEAPSWNDGVDEFKDAINNEAFTQVNAFVRLLFNKNIHMGTGEIINADSDAVDVNFRVGDEVLTFKKKLTPLRYITDSVAEFVMEKFDPYALAGYYLKTRRNANCRRICQELLNDDDPDNDGFALTLRGTSFIEFAKSSTNVKAEKILLQAVPLIEKKRVWLTYNNLGVVYFYQEEYVKAAKMYEKSIDANSKNFGSYLNYGNVLRIEYEKSNKKSSAKIDSAIAFYQKSIDMNKTDKNAYLMLIIALYDKGKSSEAEDYFAKLTEMLPNDFTVYYTIGVEQAVLHLNSQAVSNLSIALKVCKDCTQKSNIKNYIDVASRP